MGGRIYTVEESDVPGLYHIGLYTIAGLRKMKIRTHDYYKKVDEPHHRVPHHRDHNTGELYEYVPPADVERYKYQYNQIEPSIDEAVNHHNIEPANLEETHILEELGELDRQHILDDKEKEEAKKMRHIVRQERLKQTGEVFKNVGKTVTEPATKTLGLFQRGADHLAGTSEDLMSSPFFLATVVVGGIIAVKYVL